MSDRTHDQTVSLVAGDGPRAMIDQLSLRLRVFLFFALLAFGSMAIIGGSLWFAGQRFGPDTKGALMFGGLVSVFLLYGLIAWVWQLFDENVAKAIERLAADLRTRTHGSVDGEIDRHTARYLGDLAPAAAAMTENLSHTKGNVEAAVAETTAGLRTETSRLTALLSDVQAGLLVCSPNHQLVFYNAPSVEMLSDAGRPRLDRSIFDLLREGPIRHTYRRLAVAESDAQDAELLVTTVTGGRSLSAHMRLFSGALGIDDAPGYVLTLRDVTADLATHTERERLLSEVVDRLRSPATDLVTLLDQQAASGGAGSDPGLDSRIAETARDLAEGARDATARYDAAHAIWWPLQEVDAGEFVDGVRALLDEGGPQLDASDTGRMLHCDGYLMMTLCARLARGLAARPDGAGPVRIDVSGDGEKGAIRLSGSGAPVSADELRALLSQPIDDGAGAMTLREVLDRHGTTVRPEPAGGAVLAIPIRTAAVPAKVRKAGAMAERPPVFDFSLLQLAPDRTKTGRKLSELTYVVFDTETTGLEPHRGDEIVQIAAVRLINGRRVQGEVLDTLVDPERPIPPSATEVHGINDAMVATAPTIRDAGAQFHRFSHNAVLVAHNAPFDMAFFHRHAARIGAEFDHPVFDTVLLSAILFGQSAEHTLDALAARFGVVIPEKDRHTAIGDTVATAEVFQRMLPMLEARGYTTYDDVLAEMKRNTRLMREMKARVGGEA